MFRFEVRFQAPHWCGKLVVRTPPGMLTFIMFKPPPQGMSRYTFLSPYALWVTVLQGRLRENLGDVIQSLPEYFPMPPNPIFEGYHAFYIKGKTHIDVSQGRLEEDLETILVIGKGMDKAEIETQINILLTSTRIQELEVAPGHLEMLAAVAQAIDPEAMPPELNMN